MPRATKPAPAALRAIGAHAAHESAVADAYAHLEQLFPNMIWRHACGAIEIKPRLYSTIQWSPSFETKIPGFKATFGRFAFAGHPYQLTLQQLEALTAYAATVETPPPAAALAQGAA